MSKGILVQCVEEAEIVNLGEKFIQDKLYTAIPEKEIVWVITRNHTPFKFTKDQFNKHFKSK